MDTPKHHEQMVLLLQSLRLAWKDRTDFYSGGNMFFYFSEVQSRRKDFRGPDVFVVLGVDQHERKSWFVWEEDGRCPDVIIELTSPSTWHIDHGEKMVVYARLGIPEYFIFDPLEGTFEGFVLDPSRRAYRPLEPDARGWMRSNCLGLWLGVEQNAIAPGEERGPYLRWYDDEGRRLPSPREALEEAEARARADATRAESEAARAESEAARAESEAARAESEAARVRALEEKLAEYERRFGKP